MTPVRGIAIPLLAQASRDTVRPTPPLSLASAYHIRRQEAGGRAGLLGDLGRARAPGGSFNAGQHYGGTCVVTCRQATSYWEMALGPACPLYSGVPGAVGEVGFPAYPFAIAGLNGEPVVPPGLVALPELPGVFAVLTLDPHVTAGAPGCPVAKTAPVGRSSEAPIERQARVCFIFALRSGNSLHSIRQPWNSMVAFEGGSSDVHPGRPSFRVRAERRVSKLCRYAQASIRTDE